MHQRQTVHRLTTAFLGLLLSASAVRPAVAENGSPFQVTHAGRFQFVADYRFTHAKQAGVELESMAQKLWSELMIPDKRTPVHRVAGQKRLAGQPARPTWRQRTGTAACGLGCDNPFYVADIHPFGLAQGKHSCGQRPKQFDCC